MASNITNTCHTKHVGIRYKYFNEYVEDGVVKIVVAKSADDDNNILTKNLRAELHEEHSQKWWVRSLETLLASKIFEVKRKSVKDDVLTSNIRSRIF